LILQFIGVLRASGFDTYFRLIFEMNGLQMPLVPLYRDHLGEFGFFEGIYGFLVVGNNSCLRGVCVQILLKNNFRIFLARTEMFSVFFVSCKNFLEFF